MLFFSYEYLSSFLSVSVEGRRQLKSREGAVRCAWRVLLSKVKSRRQQERTAASIFPQHRQKSRNV